ncbi:SinI family restriction endonuclease [Providencia heimbachae]|uniref:SinI family restriction endonuclease n=1 Tax=Providencia heimbachae TaxID=333962 RepID=UPI0008397228|nr:SinI family restriction endonuclease [Providencia heimbachae]NIH22125.1 SinI family restriction endonuclease [Providencia heimbachae]
MCFISNHREVAISSLTNTYPELAHKYAYVIQFLSEHPEAASALRGALAPNVGSEDYIVRQANSFASGRLPRAPAPPSTIPDEMTSVILTSYFDIQQSEVMRIKHEHSLSMGAENFVGELLERYLASVMENEGWIWCSGSVVRAVDFIKPPATQNDSWTLLQVKNRDNSENSSSSAIRLGTNITKWHRTFSRRAETNWNNFPDNYLRDNLSEEGFTNFVRTYLTSLR